MITAPRKRFVIIAIVLLVTAACIAFEGRRVREAVSFALLSPTEKKVVGEWTSISIGGPVVMAVRADHTWTSIGGCLKPDFPINGWWKVDGSDIVYSVDLPAIDDSPPLQPIRQSIQELIAGNREAHEWLARNKEK